MAFMVVGAIGQCASENMGKPAVAEGPKADISRIREIEVGMKMDQVRAIVGEPDRVQEMHSYGHDNLTWYVGEWQFNFDNGYLDSFNKF